MNPSTKVDLARRATPPAPRVQLHIERLVLTGFNAPPAQLRRFSAALTQQLERHLADARFGSVSSVSLARSDTPMVQLPVQAPDARAARSVAAAVISSLSGATGRKVDFSNAAIVEAALAYNRKPQR